MIEVALDPVAVGDDCGLGDVNYLVLESVGVVPAVVSESLWAGAAELDDAVRGDEHQRFLDHGVLAGRRRPEPKQAHRLVNKQATCTGQIKRPQSSALADHAEVVRRRLEVLQQRTAFGDLAA
jgi:hypothetical protein